jgi:hypothetical protein
MCVHYSRIIVMYRLSTQYTAVRIICILFQYLHYCINLITKHVTLVDEWLTISTLRGQWRKNISELTEVYMSSVYRVSLNIVDETRIDDPCDEGATNPMRTRRESLTHMIQRWHTNAQCASLPALYAEFMTVNAQDARLWPVWPAWPVWQGGVYSNVVTWQTSPCSAM